MTPFIRFLLFHEDERKMPAFNAKLFIIVLGVISSVDSSFFAATISTTSAAQCSLCPDGSPPGNPNVVVAVPVINQDLQCSLIDPLLKQLNSTDPFCQLAQLVLGSQCGCPKVNITGTPCPGVCLDGSLPSHPSRILPIDLTGSGQYGITCLQAHSFVQQLPTTDQFCQLSGMMGQFCGCSKAPSSCTPCYGNSVMPDYTKKINLAGAVLSCGNYALLQLTQSMNSGTFNSTTCTNLQSTGSPLCDCVIPEPPANATCSLCNSDQSLLPNAVYNYAALNYSITCGNIDSSIANMAATECTSGKAMFTDVLTTCCSNTLTNQTSSSSSRRISYFGGKSLFFLIVATPWFIL